MSVNQSCQFLSKCVESTAGGTALLLEGGGMRGGFVAGALMALYDAGLTGFDYSLAVSASVPTMAYFKAGHREKIESIWRRELTTPEIIQLRNYPAASFALTKDRPILNIDHLVDVVFKEKYPLDIDRLQKNPMQAFFAATNVKDRSLMFFTDRHPDIYSVFKAAMAVPACYLESVYVDGQECIDGGLIDFLPIHCLADYPVQRMVVVLTRPVNTLHYLPGIIEKSLFYRFFSKNEWMFEKLQEAEATYDQTVTTLQSICEQSPQKIMVIAPEKRLPTRFISRNQKRVNQTIDLGYIMVSERQNTIREFLTAGKSETDKPLAGVSKIGTTRNA